MTLRRPRGGAEPDRRLIQTSAHLVAPHLDVGRVRRRPHARALLVGGEHEEAVAHEGVDVHLLPVLHRRLWLVFVGGGGDLWVGLGVWLAF